MQAFNFSKLNTRDKKIYGFADINLSKKGFDFRFLVITGVLVAISIVIALILSSVIGFSLNPIENATPLLITLSIPVLLGCALFYLKINNYRLFDFLVVYFTPKHTINTAGIKVTRELFKYNAFLENQYYLLSSQRAKEKKRRKAQAKARKGKR